MHDIDKRIEQWRAGLTGSEFLGSSSVNELENHLREEMEHLRTSGLSDEEAFFVARHRLGDTAALEEEFAKVDPYRRLAHRLYWMATGILGYFLVLHLSLCATKVSTLLGYMAGMRNSYLTILACIVQVTAFAGIGTLVLRHHTSHSKSQAARKISGSVRAGIFVACAIVALWWIENLSNYFLVRTMPIRDYVQLSRASGWASFGWSLLMPFLVVGLTAILALRDRRRAEVQ